MIAEELKEALRGSHRSLPVTVNIAVGHDPYTQFAVKAVQVTERYGQCLLIAQPLVLTGLEENMAKVAKEWVECTLRARQEEACRRNGIS